MKYSLSFIVIFFLINSVISQEKKSQKIIEDSNAKICSCVEKKRKPNIKGLKKCYKKVYTNKVFDSIVKLEKKEDNQKLSMHERFINAITPLSSALEVFDRIARSCPKVKNLLLEEARKKEIHTLRNKICKEITSDKEKFQTFWDVDIITQIDERRENILQLLYYEHYVKYDNEKIKSEKILILLDQLQSDIKKELRKKCRYYRKLYKKVLKS